MFRLTPRWLWPTLLGILSLKFAVTALYLLSGELPLAPDEAQYWTWSQMLDWGYYSKPPAIAWQIWLGTRLFGETEFGVRFASLVMSTGMSLSIYHLARSAALKAQTAFWAAICFALSPMGLASGVLATTDGGLVLFWTLACAPVARALYLRQPIPYLSVGLYIAAGALFKWPIYLLWVLILPFCKWHRISLKGSVRGIAASLVGLSPSLVWNLNNDWATFRHVGATIAARPGEIAPSGNLADFIGAQAGLLGPILFGMLVSVLVLYMTRTRRLSLPLQFYAFVTLFLLTTYSGSAIIRKMQGNWVVFAYPTAFVLIAWYGNEMLQRWGRPVLAAGCVTGTALSLMVAAIPAVQSREITVAGQRVPYKANIFRHNLGWSRLNDALHASGYHPEAHFLSSPTYQVTSELSFYAPGQNRAHMLNVWARRKNQFSYWPGMEFEKGRTGYFVFVEDFSNGSVKEKRIIRRLEESIAPYFDSVQLVAKVPLFESYGRQRRGALIFKGYRFNGEPPTDPAVY